MPAPRPPLVERFADPLVLVEMFAVANIAFLAVDIGIAHAINAFEHPAEWVPVAFSLAATPVLLIAMAVGGVRPTPAGSEEPGSRGTRQRAARWLGLAVGAGSVAVGIAGLLLHLESQFFREATLKNLVYTAPFVAPLAYTGVGLLLLLDRMVDARTVEWARWVTLLALGGFVGNFILCVCDHAQNGFFRPEEWTGVIAAAAATGALAAVLVVYDNRPLLRLGFAVMLAQVAVGLLGAFWHVRANLGQPMGTLWQKFLYGGPAVAPLLFADLAALAILALWALARAVPAPTPADSRPLEVSPSATPA
jgi:hypothetical protein